MSRSQTSLEADYFDRMYAADLDPWKFETSAYERDKYDATLAALPAPRYRAALEIGCSIGVLTQRLASRCDALLALDVSDAALERARRRCIDEPKIAFARAKVPADWPDGRFDLILLSEVVYYLDPRDVRRLASNVTRSLIHGGDIVLVHWLGETDYPLTGDAAATLFIEAMTGHARVVDDARTEHYRLDVLRATAGPP